MPTERKGILEQKIKYFFLNFLVLWEKEIACSTAWM